MAARIAASCAVVRSVGTLIVLAPRSATTRAAAGFATGSITETLACIDAGRSPERRMAAKTDNTPMSWMSTLRMPCAAARCMSSSTATSCSVPRAAGATSAPTGARAIADASQPAFGRAKRLTSTALRAISYLRVEHWALTSRDEDRERGVIAPHAVDQMRGEAQVLRERVVVHRHQQVDPCVVRELRRLAVVHVPDDAGGLAEVVAPVYWQ